MCLAVPGKIVAVRGENPADAAGRVGTVDFQGSRIEASLAFTPDARPGDWVLVHAGFALQVLDEQAARETWQYLDQAELEELSPAGTGDGGRDGKVTR